MEKRLFTVKEIESALGIGHTKTAELIRTGEIQTIKIGRRRLAPAESIQNFIERKLEESAA